MRNIVDSPFCIVPLAMIGVAACMLSDASRTCAVEQSVGPNIDDVLGKWEAATSACRSIDVRITRHEYGLAFGTSPRTTVCRFYYEAAGDGRLDFLGHKEWEEESLIWNDGGLLWIQWSEKRHTTIPASQLAEIVQRYNAVNTESPEWKILSLMSFWPASVSSPAEALPMVIGINADEMRRRFDLAVESVDGDYWLTAARRHTPDTHGFAEIVVIIDGASFLTKATKVIPPDGRRHTVWVLGEPKIHQVPAARGVLLNPKLTNFAEQNLLLTTGKR